MKTKNESKTSKVTLFNFSYLKQSSTDGIEVKCTLFVNLTNWFIQGDSERKIPLILYYIIKAISFIFSLVYKK